VADRLHVSGSTRSVLRRENVFYADDDPVHRVTTYIPWSIAEGTGLLPDEVPHQFGIHGVLEERHHVMTRTVDSSTAGIINATTPLRTVLLALAVRHQKSVTSWPAAGLIVGFGGALLIFSPWGSSSSVASAGGLECLAASVSYAISYIYMDRYVARRGLSPVTLSACQLLVASIMLAVTLAIVGAQAPHFTAVSVAGVVILGVIGTGIAYVLNYQIITSEGATIASTVTYLLPVVAIVPGVVVLGEDVTAMVIAGIALVLAGVALTRRHPKAADEP
jgi:drug/metabolite transporter (DMT)-like permease